MRASTGRGLPRRPRPGRSLSSGFTSVDLLLTIAVLAIVGGIAIPSSLTLVYRARGTAAARYLAGRMALARAQAVARSANVALRFEAVTDGFTIATFVDGNRNGVRTADIDSGIDYALDRAVKLADMFPGVAIALGGDSGSADPVRIGATTLLSFTANGTATSGTIYVRGFDGKQFALRVLGVTARVRTLEYRDATAEWIDIR